MEIRVAKSNQTFSALNGSEGAKKEKHVIAEAFAIAIKPAIVSSLKKEGEDADSGFSGFATDRQAELISQTVASSMAPTLERQLQYLLTKDFPSQR